VKALCLKPHKERRLILHDRYRHGQYGASASAGRAAAGCVERIRVREVVRAGGSEQPDVVVLHRIAEQVQACCGMNAWKPLAASGTHGPPGAETDAEGRVERATVVTRFRHRKRARAAY
jgi:hypothetical protein